MICVKYAKTRGTKKSSELEQLIHDFWMLICQTDNIVESQARPIAN